jgi:hypothetical protein
VDWRVRPRPISVVGPVRIIGAVKIAGPVRIVRPICVALRPVILAAVTLGSLLIGERGRFGQQFSVARDNRVARAPL